MRQTLRLVAELGLLCVLLLAGCRGDTAAREAAEIEAQVDALLARMTLAEKIGQMTLVEKDSVVAADIATLGIGGLLSGGGGYPTPNTPEAWAAMIDGFQAQTLESRLEIPLLYGVDAVHGHNNLRGAVIFPHNVGLGATRDPELVEQIGRATATEMLATAATWNYAPCVAVPQDVRWGRTYEGYGQDAALVTELGTAYLRGLQGSDLDAPSSVLATPKHYVGDGGTTWGSATTSSFRIDQGVTDVDEATLRAIHLPPYIAAVEAGARSIMVSYSSWGGVRMHAHRTLIQDVLKGELGFTGFVVSDWAGVDQISPSYAEAVVTAVNAGIDMVMVPQHYQRFIATLTDAVEAGDVPVERIDDAARRILRVKLEMGLFDRPFSDPALLDRVGSDPHRALAREAVARSLVLLKNDGELLPLPRDLAQLAVAGRAADNVGIQCGGWTIEWQGRTGAITPGTTILAGIRATVSAETTVVYEANGQFGDAGAAADACLAVVGERPYAEGQGDSSTLALPADDHAMLARLRKTCDRLVVVLVAGRPLIVTEQLNDWDAFVVAWLPGTEGQGVADGLFGTVPFGGRLPYAWPRSVDQLPLGIADDGGLFPYGYGLTTQGHPVSVRPGHP